MRSALPLTAVLLLAGCASAPPSVFKEEPVASRVRIVPLFDADNETALAQDTQRTITTARTRSQQARRSARYRDREALLTQAEQAAREGNNPRAQSLARQASARAEAAADTQREREAAGLLKKLYDTTGLSDRQLAGLRAAEAALVRGESAAALRQLQAIQTIATKPRDYTVQGGDTLSGIASRDAVYGNSLLWPLLWEANRDRVPDPHRLKAGMTLTIRPSPTIEQVVQAIRTAREYPARVRIGTVKTLPKP
jgi:nucleoid-associated protein YgaU